MQGSTSNREMPAKTYFSDDPEAIIRWQQRVIALRNQTVRTNTPRPINLRSTVYQRHASFVANMPTSYDLREDERRAVDGPDTDKMQTFIMPAVTPPKAPDSPVRYICYSRADNPLMMLYGAVIASIRAFDRTPDVLFISASQEAALATETERVTGRKYDRRFFTFDTRAVAGNLKSYPILTEDELPDQLMHELKGYIAHDTVVVAIER